MSLISSSARIQFAAGVALIAVIPMLALWYLTSREGVEGITLDSETVAVLFLMVTLGATGYVLLRKYPVNIVRLRGYLEQMIAGELPQQVTLLQAEDDVAAVEECLNLLLAQLRERVEVLKQEKSNLQRQLYQAQKMESLGTMAAGVAHDFNNVLMGIMGNLDLVSDSLPKDAPARKNIEDIQTFVQHASDLTSQMMVYAGRGRFSMEPVNVSALIADMLQLLKSSVGKSVMLVDHLKKDIPTVQGDPTQLRQVVMNLVINASEAMKKAGGTITVATRLARGDEPEFAKSLINGTVPEGDCVCIEVADTGPGMDGDRLSRIFDPFYTTKPKGKGLGLAIVLGIVLGHKGAILAESRPGHGVHFRILLPVPKAAPEA